LFWGLSAFARHSPGDNKMPWSTPSLRDVRSLVRDHIRGSLPGADASVPNSVLRVMSDAQGGLCHLNLQYLDWLALQLLPDTAETEWLDRHGDIWLVNSDASVGRKNATFAAGSVTMTGTVGIVVPTATRLRSSDGIEYETTEEIIIGSGPTSVAIRAIDPGAIGNRELGVALNIVTPPIGVVGEATVVSLLGGTDEENDDDLRTRVLLRIRQPPMGGDATDYVQWALAVPGVTRAWSFPLEMGIGTVTVRFMMDELRASNNGFPLQEDVDAAWAYLDTVRPVAVKDFWILAPIPYPIDFTIAGFSDDTEANRAAIEAALRSMILAYSEPGGTIYRSWAEEAIAAALTGDGHYELIYDTTAMPSNGHIAVLGSIIYQ
jgi:uncharacterized phage protein gp47/JayE